MFVGTYIIRKPYFNGKRIFIHANIESFIKISTSFGHFICVVCFKVRSIVFALKIYYIQPLNRPWGTRVAL